MDIELAENLGRIEQVLVLNDPMVSSVLLDTVIHYLSLLLCIESQ
jgi:hypothetical protein